MNFIPIGRAVLAGLILLVLTGGCATNQMKGTPFYTGISSTPQNQSTDRVNLWPLFYYRSSALSILWPIIEQTDEHFAVRPLYSVYGLDHSNRIYSVLWPLTEFDRQAGNNWIFPVFWGSEYRVIPPLYWHFNEPLGDKGGYDGLVPFWSYYRDKNKTSAYFPWPIARYKKDSLETGGYFFPFFGSYTRHDGYYRFQAWPLAHQWASKVNESQAHTVIPFYWRYRDLDESIFLSLPWSAGSSKNGDFWQLMPPFFYHNADQAAQRSCFITPLWSTGACLGNHEKWQTLFPVYWRRRNDAGTCLVTLLGGYSSDAYRNSWLIVPLLAKGYADEKESAFWFAWPLIHRWRSGNCESSHVFPFYYRQKSGESQRFLSLPWSSGSDLSGRSWRFIPPFFYHSTDKAGSRLLTPLWASGKSDIDQTRWQALIPFYFREQSVEGTLLATLLGGYRTDATGNRWLIYPLLSWGGQSRDEKEFWAVAPLVHAQWGGTDRSHHVLPFYYWNSQNNVFLSLAAARWQGASSDVVLVPPLLSWMTSNEKRKDLWLAAALAHFSWGEQKGSQHVIPFFYRQPQDGTFFSPLYANYKADGRSHRVFPPLLSKYSQGPDDREILGLLAMFRSQWNSEGVQAGHLIPFYLYHAKEGLYTPLFGWNKSRNGFVYPFTPLVGFHRGDYSGGWLFPFYTRKTEDATGKTDGRFLWGTFRNDEGHRNSGLFPFYCYDDFGPLDSKPDPHAKSGHYGKSLLCLPGIWYRNEKFIRPEPVRQGITNQAASASSEDYRRGNGWFPFWSYSRNSTPAKGQDKVKRSVLLCLYDYQHNVSADPVRANGVNESVQSRVLYWLWNYSRSNDTVCVDMIPAITYDRKGDRFKKVSFLLRFFRYERDEQGHTAVDLCFIPVMRRKGGKNSE